MIPTSATVPNGINNVGGADNAFASNIANTDDGRNYYGAYFQDDWKATPKLTLNLGLRWDFFGQVEENYGAQGNIFPGAPFAGARYLIPIERQKDPLSTSFLNTLAKDGIQLVYTQVFGLGVSQKTNFAPRVGFPYELTKPENRRPRRGPSRFRVEQKVIPMYSAAQSVRGAFCVTTRLATSKQSPSRSLVPQTDPPRLRSHREEEHFHIRRCAGCA